VKYRKLGKTSIKVSEIGLGTSQIGNIDGTLPGVKPITKAEAMRILETALDGGINFFDTSDGYGAAEELVGELPQEKKKQAFLATKAGLMDSGERCFSQDYLILQAENSLRKLKVEAIDLFQLNKPTAEDIKNNEVFHTLSLLKEQGKIRFSGIGIGSLAAGDEVVNDASVDSIMVLFHLLYHGAIPLMIRACQMGLGIIVRSPFCSGLLTGKIKNNEQFDANDERKNYFTKAVIDERLKIVEDIKKNLRISDRDLSRLAIEYILSKEDVSTVIPGPSKIKQVDQLLAFSKNLKTLDEVSVAMIENVVAQFSHKLKSPFQNS